MQIKRWSQVIVFVALLFGPAHAQLITPVVYERITTEHFFVEVAIEGFEVPEGFAREADVAYNYVKKRMGSSFSGRIKLSFQAAQPGPCPGRGSAGLLLENTYVITLYPGEHVDEEDFVPILAHELGHVFHWAGYGATPHHGGLAQGLASWAAGEYWVRWQSAERFADLVQRYVHTNGYLALVASENLTNIYPHNAEDATCLARRDRLFSEWAAFIDYLIATYGEASFKELLATSADTRPKGGTRTIITHSKENESGLFEVTQPLPPEPDFKGVYNLELADLEAAWLASLELPR